MSKRNQKVVGEICLYGTTAIGAGYLAQAEGGYMIGNGEPKAGRSMTEAVWLACDELRMCGIQRGLVRVYAPGGRFVAATDINHPVYYGNLKWESAAPACVVSVA